MATIFNPVTSGYIPDRDLTFPRVSVDSVSSDFTETSDEDGSASGQESSFWESSDQGDSVDSDSSTQYSGSLSSTEHNGIDVMSGRSEGTSNDGADVMQWTSPADEVNDETKHLSSDVQRSKRVLRPRNSRGRCVPPKKRIRLVESSGEDEPGSQSDIQQSGGTGVNKGLSVTDTSIGASEFSNDDGSEMMQKTSPTDKVRDESEPPSGDVRTVKRVLRPHSARGRCAPRKQLHFEDAGSSSEDEPETHVRGKRGGGGASVRGRGNRSAANRSGRGGKRSGSTDGKGSSGTSGRKRTGSARLPSEAIDINIKDSQFHEPDEFCPLREPGPYVPSGGAISALSLFELFFDAMVIARIISATLSYAEANRETKKKQYKLFMKRNFGKVQLMAFIGALILLGIHNVRNHRKAWSTNKAQVLYRLRDLLTCQYFELIGTFIHVVTIEEEEESKHNRLRKVQPLIDYVKSKCFEFYQPRQEMSVDERMVKSKARCHLVQYMRNKPVKWGFKLWVLADMSGYTIDFNIYTGKSSECTDHGLSHDVVMELVQPFAFQGYQVYVDNFYSSPDLFTHLLEYGITATGTLRTNRRGVPGDVVVLKEALDKRSVTRGTGYYIRDPESSIVYSCWRDKRVVTVMTTAHPGHSERNVERKVIDGKTGKMTTLDIPRPVPVEMYNRFMGGVDKSDQFLAYHNVLRKTVHYWKTLFYHIIDVCVVNSFILYNNIALLSGCRTVTENDFRDDLILQIIEAYGRHQQEAPSVGRPSRSECRVRHGSVLVSSKGRCQYCKLIGKGTNLTQRVCSDCLFQPSLCQTKDRNCHYLWHSPSFDGTRELWTECKQRKRASVPEAEQPPHQGRGRPKGAINKNKRRGNYRSRSF